MRTIVVALSLIVLATSSYAAQRPSLEKMCRQLAGKEVPEATDVVMRASSMCNASATA
jgi:hypothetical protein